MKRKLIILIFCLLSICAFAFDTSAGVGATGGYFLWRYTYTYVGLTTTYTQTYLPMTFYGFLDATYLEASIGYMLVDGYSVKNEVTGFPTATSDFKENLRWISFAALFKYPFHFGSVSLFPLAGFEYDMNISYTDSSGNDLKSSLTADQKAQFDQLWIKAGLGADFVFGSFYIRPKLLAGYKLLAKIENDTVAADKSGGETNVSIVPLVFSVGISAGYRL